MSPYDFSGDVIKLADKHGLKKELIIFHGRIKNKKPETIASEVWPVERLANGYKNYLDRIQESAGELNTRSNPGSALTFLYFFGSELFHIIQDDPQIPLDLLPVSWPGTDAAQSFWQIREQLLSSAHDFIEGILQEKPLS